MDSTLTTVASIFLLIVVGYGTKKVGILSTKDEDVLNSILINITLPALIFVSTIGNPVSIQMVKSPITGWIAEAVVIGMAYGLSRLLRLDRKTAGAFVIVSAFGNTGYMGYPVAKVAFPDDPQGLLTAVFYDNFGMRLGLITAGVVIAVNSAGESFKWSNLVQFLKTPLLPAVVVALMLRNCEIPPLIMDALTHLGAPTVALSMLSLGLNLSTGAVREYPAPLAAAAVLKMGLFPLLTWLLLAPFGLTGTVAQATLLESAMPSAVFSGVVASKFGANGRFAAAAIFITTLISAVLIPALAKAIS